MKNIYPFLPWSCLSCIPLSYMADPYWFYAIESNLQAAILQHKILAYEGSYDIFAFVNIQMEKRDKREL